MSPRSARTAATATFAACAAMLVFTLTFGVLARDAADSASWSAGGLWAGAAFVVAMFAYPVVGYMLTARRPGNAIGWILLAIGVSWGLANATVYSDYAIKLHHDVPGAVAVAVVGDAFWLPAIGLTGTFLILLFPEGRLLPGRWRWVAWTSGAAISLGLFCMLFAPGTLADSGYPHVRNPVGIDAAGSVLDAAKLAILFVPLMMLASAASLIVRFRRSTGSERMQLKWLAAAAAAVAGCYAVVLPVSALLYPSSTDPPGWLIAAQTVALLSFGLIPVAIGIAVLRYRLYDIDVIIRRTLVYAVLVAVLALVYLGGVTIVGGLLRSVTGGSGAAAVTVTTLAVAAAFQPLRGRIQRLVDRRFYRARYDASRTLEAFSERLRDQVDLEAMGGEMLGIVQETLQPAHASLWLRPPVGER